jgi:hypothetical protein
MPYSSERQRRYFNANRKKLEAQGVNVDEWNDSSRGKKLPKKVKKAELDGFMDELTKIADLASMVLSQLARREVIPPVTEAVSNMEGSIADKWRRFGSGSNEF